MLIIYARNFANIKYLILIYKAMENKIYTAFTNRILFYGFLKNYFKKGNSIHALKYCIKHGIIKKIPFDVPKNEAIIIINDFIATSKKLNVSNNGQLVLFQ